MEVILEQNYPAAVDEPILEEEDGEEEVEVVLKRARKGPYRAVDKQPVYAECLITKRIALNLNIIGTGHLHDILLNTIAKNVEGRCAVEGYVKPKSCKLVSFSSGVIEAGNLVTFVVNFKCLVCSPAEGTIIECLVKNITKAGIRAELNCPPYESSPIVVFIATEHHYNTSHEFHSVKEKDIIDVTVIGQRYELNDSYVSIIGSLTKKKRN